MCMLNTRSCIVCVHVLLVLPSFYPYQISYLVNDGLWNVLYRCCDHTIFLKVAC